MCSSLVSRFIHSYRATILVTQGHHGNIAFYHITAEYQTIAEVTLCSLPCQALYCVISQFPAYTLQGSRLCLFTQVMEAAVIAVPHPKWTERPLLVVVAAPDSSLTRDVMLQFLQVGFTLEPQKNTSVLAGEAGIPCKHATASFAVSKGLLSCIGIITARMG